MYDNNTNVNVYRSVIMARNHCERSLMEKAEEIN